VLSIKTTRAITGPINDLISHVTNIGQDLKSEENSEKIRKSINLPKLKLDEINYPEDKDINDLFQICKSLIKGGFNNEVSDNYLTNAPVDGYNNIAYIKSNNIIIQEDYIESSVSTHQSIFSYGRDSLEEKRKEKENDMWDSPKKKKQSVKFLQVVKGKKKTLNNFSQIKCTNPSQLENSIYNIIKEEDIKDDKKGYLYHLFMKNTNNGEELKILNL
jgi:hypothetical protein